MQLKNDLQLHLMMTPRRNIRSRDGHVRSKSVQEGKLRNRSVERSNGERNNGAEDEGLEDVFFNMNTFLQQAKDSYDVLVASGRRNPDEDRLV